MLQIPTPWLIMAGAGLVVSVPLGLYVWGLYNELATKLERLHSLLATARLMKARRHAVGRAIQRHVGRSARHIESTTRHTARGKRGGRYAKVNMDGFPEQRLIDLANHGMTDNVQACGMETDAQVLLRTEAAQYNARLRSFPACLIAPALGFRVWKTHQGQAKFRGRNGAGSRRIRG